MHELQIGSRQSNSCSFILPTDTVVDGVPFQFTATPPPRTTVCISLQV